VSLIERASGGSGRPPPQRPAGERGRSGQARGFGIDVSSLGERAPASRNWLICCEELGSNSLPRSRRGAGAGLLGNLQRYLVEVLA